MWNIRRISGGYVVDMGGTCVSMFYSRENAMADMIGRCESIEEAVAAGFSLRSEEQILKASDRGRLHVQYAPL